MSLWRKLNGQDWDPEWDDHPLCVSRLDMVLIAIILPIVWLAELIKQPLKPLENRTVYVREHRRDMWHLVNKHSTMNCGLIIPGSPLCYRENDLKEFGHPANICDECEDHLRRHGMKYARPDKKRYER